MSDAQSFIWYELMTTDPGAAKAFYRKVVGWEMQAFGGGTDYTVLDAGDGQVGGIMALPTQARATGLKPCWLGYIGVDDVDAAADRIAKAGGAIHRAPEDIPGVGRFAVVADPQGAAFMLLKGTTDGPPPKAFKATTPRHVGWNELHTTDWKAGLAFYSKLFGWAKSDAFDMGAMGTYLVFNAGGDAIGGMMTSPNFPRPVWLFYFNVDSIDAGHRRLTDAGGQVLFGPSEVPGGGWIIQATDPQGAMFALVGPRTS
jgi:predicted enzyme related to lactoylglutathione lyase